MKLELVTLLILAFAAFRITRLAVIDTIFEGFRAKFHTFLVNIRPKEGKISKFFAFLAHKALELTSCTWCFGVWVSFFLYWVFSWISPANFSRLDWINVAAIAGIQGLLHSWESE